MAIPCHSRLHPLLENFTGAAFLILLFYTHIHFLHANGWWWTSWMTYDIHMLCAQKHPFPTASLRGSCSSNVQRLNLTTLWCWKLDMTISLGWSSLEEGEARAFPEIQWQYCSLLAGLQYQKHLRPQHWNHSSNYKLFHIFRPGFIENPFVYFLLPKEQALPCFLLQNYWQLDILSFTHSTEVIWIAKAFSLLFSLTLGFLQCESYFYTWR